MPQISATATSNFSDSLKAWFDDLTSLSLSELTYRAVNSKPSPDFISNQVNTVRQQVAGAGGGQAAQDQAASEITNFYSSFFPANPAMAIIVAIGAAVVLYIIVKKVL